jgi:hypothetical protein
MKQKIIIAIMLCAICTAHLAGAQEVQTDDLGGKVILIGRLGKPLGTVATINGQITTEPRQTKSGTVIATIRVGTVDGNPVGKTEIIPLIFRHSAGIPTIHLHDIVQLSGYEGGAYVGTPDDAREMLDKEASPLKWKFETTIYVISYKPSEP